MNNIKKRHWKTTIIIPDYAISTFENISSLKDCAILISEIEEGINKNKWQMEIITPEKPDLSNLDLAITLAAKACNLEKPSYDVTSFEDKDWLTESLASFPPVYAGRFFVYGSHEKTPPPRAMFPIKIDAATAFGSGEHHTTKGCLIALCQLNKKYKFRRILDMGCGSGILSFGAAHLWRTASINAVDNDSEAVRVTINSAKKNHLQHHIKSFVGDGYKKTPICYKNKKYDLIIANILAKPLSLMAKSLNSHLNRGGYAVLSGLLNRQENWVLSSHYMTGLKLVKRIRINGWSTLVIAKPNLAPSKPIPKSKTNKLKRK
ncbi:MAG: 50S ribosomal protein L11 methyltransferase [Alphaproteobacteria bacterium]